MSKQRSRQAVTLSLVLGAVVFGMVLAGGLELTPSGESSQESYAAPDRAVRPDVQIQGLPGFADLADAVSEAVVSVAAVRTEPGPRRRGPDPFEFFFGPRGRDEEGDGEPEEFRRDSGGSGFVIDEGGLVVTNFHVIDGATELTVHLGDRDYPAEVRGTDAATDIALLEIEADGDLPYLALGDSDGLRVGDWVMAIGNPLRFENAVTVGVVSGKGRQINITPDFALENFIQTDAAINFGNSGGPLVNLRGEVVGINTAINFGSENIGFAVPVNTLKDVLPQLRETGQVTRGYLGIQITDIDYELMQAFGLDSTDGVLVQSVEPDTPADDAGLKHGDVVLSVNGRRVSNTRELISYVASKGPGTSVELEVVRDGEELDLTVTLGARPGVEADEDDEGDAEESGIEWMGLQYQDLDPRTRSNHGIPSDVAGVWVTDVAPTSPLFEENVRPGDVITEVNGREVDGVEEFESIVAETEAGSFLRLYVMRFDPRSDRELAFFALVRVP